MPCSIQPLGGAITKQKPEYSEGGKIINKVHLVQNTKSNNSSKADSIYYRSYNLVSLRQLLISFLIQVLTPQRDISFFSQKKISGLFSCSKTFTFKGSVETHTMLKVCSINCFIIKIHLVEQKKSVQSKNVRQQMRVGWGKTVMLV